MVLLLVSTASAAVWTDQEDYEPGSVVTISGDNSDGAGYLPGETLIVGIQGPNGYTATCSAVADDQGAWSCQVMLWDDGLAIGQYTYTATGQISGANQSDQFTDFGGWNHTCYLQPNGSVDCWGAGGVGPAEDQVPAPGEPIFTQVSTGGYHTCGLKSDGSVECWGNNDWGQAEEQVPSASEPIFTQISLGTDHSCGLKSDGSVECWGDNYAGQAQDIVPNPGAPIFTQVAAGSEFTCGLKSDGSVDCWGVDPYGFGATQDQVPGPGESIFTQISAGSGHTCGLKADGSVECWGWEGYGPAEDRVPGPSEPIFTQVSAGGYHTCGLKSDGSVECWGWDGWDFGQMQDQVPAPGEPIFTQVSAGGYHTCGLKSDQSVDCWGGEGYTDNGQATDQPGPYVPFVIPDNTPPASLCNVMWQELAGGMVGYWTFDNSAALGADVFNLQKGTVNGNPDHILGKSGGALDLDGVNDFVDLGTSKTLTDWPTYSLNIWFRHMNKGEIGTRGYGQKIISKAAFYRDFHLQIITNDSAPGWLNLWTHYNPSSPGSRGTHLSLVDYRNFMDETWHHAVVTKNGDWGELWVDGEMVDSGPIHSPNTSDKKLYLGYTPHTDHYQQRHFGGTIDEFAIFDRVLSSDEIQRLYELGNSGRNACFNYPPMAADDAYTTTEDQSLNTPAAIGVLTNDADYDNHPLTATLVSSVSHGTLAFNADGSFNYTTSPDYFGLDSFTYIANDGTADSNSATVSITVNPINDDPTLTINNTSIEVDEIQIAANNGTFHDVDVSDNVAISASVGTITQDGGNSGGWNWLLETADGPADSQTVTITADDGQGGSAQVIFNLVVHNVPPTANFSNDGPVNEGDVFTLSLSDSYDPSSVDVTAGIQYAFDCGDGGGYSAFGPAAGVNCPTSDSGQRSVRAKIKDKDDGESAYSGTVDIYNVAPTAIFDNASGDVIAGETAQLTFSEQYDPSTADTTAGFLYAYDCTNDGTFEADDVTDTSFGCIYLDAGSFTARGRITDKDGGLTDYTVLVTVLTPAEATQVLIEFVESLNLQQGIDNSLDAKLEAAIQALEDLSQNNDGAAINTLQAFINAVEAQRGKSLTDAQADQLIDAALTIINNLSMP